MAYFIKQFFHKLNTLSDNQKYAIILNHMKPEKKKFSIKEGKKFCEELVRKVQMACIFYRVVNRAGKTGKRAVFKKKAGKTGKSIVFLMKVLEKLDFFSKIILCQSMI